MITVNGKTGRVSDFCPTELELLVIEENHNETRIHVHDVAYESPIAYKLDELDIPYKKVEPTLYNYNNEYNALCSYVLDNADYITFMLHDFTWRGLFEEWMQMDEGDFCDSDCI